MSVGRKIEYSWKYDTNYIRLISMNNRNNIKSTSRHYIYITFLGVDFDLVDMRSIDR